MGCVSNGNRHSGRCAFSSQQSAKRGIGSLRFQLGQRSAKRGIGSLRFQQSAVGKEGIGSLRFQSQVAPTTKRVSGRCAFSGQQRGVSGRCAFSGQQSAKRGIGSSLSAKRGIGSLRFQLSGRGFQQSAKRVSGRCAFSFSSQSLGSCVSSQQRGYRVAALFSFQRSAVSKEVSLSQVSGQQRHRVCTFVSSAKRFLSK